MVLLSFKKDSDDLIYDANFELLKHFGNGDTNYFWVLSLNDLFYVTLMPIVSGY